MGQQFIAPLTFFEGLVCIYKTRQKKGGVLGCGGIHQKSMLNNPFFELPPELPQFIFLKEKENPIRTSRTKETFKETKANPLQKDIV